MFLLAETVFHSMDAALSFIGVLLVILLIVIFIIGLSLEMKLGRANRIARATHDLIKAMLEEQRAERAATRIEDGGQRMAKPPPPQPDIYRID